ncbi:tetratricopeptide repeat protein 31 isoform X2 [Anolis carolinensis]|uniref:tetratricopeptide repeat protein 31 isoform X2 n=1 Tax=Anolis carolinensis TaxID=28377 RepID=UPI002F2B2D2A
MRRGRPPEGAAVRPEKASPRAPRSGSASFRRPHFRLCRPAMESSSGEEEGEEDCEEAYLRHRRLCQYGIPCREISGEICWYCEEEDYFGSEDWEDCSEEPEAEDKAQGVTQGTFCGFKKSFLCKSPSTPQQPSHRSGPDCQLLDIILPRKQQLTAEEVEKNAEELVAEEERIKREAEKKREKKKQKKKRQKDRKRKEKNGQESKDESAKSPCERDVDDQGSLAALPSTSSGAGLLDSEEDSLEASPGGSPSAEAEEEGAESPGATREEELDLSSTFVSKALLKVGSKQLLPKKEVPAKPSKKEVEGKKKPEVPRARPQEAAMEHSLVLAGCGNDTAKQGCYQDAVLLFTEAIKLNPREYRFFGNRSFCYERLQCYAEALCDAQLALSLQPGWPKGLFRQGKALMGLKRYAEAARTFEELMRLEDFRGDAAIQLKRCQAHCLLENSSCLPRWNIPPREALLPWPGEQQGRKPVPSSNSSAQAGGHLAPFMVTNSQGKVIQISAAQVPAKEWFPVWVGNLVQAVTEEVLLRYFLPFGPIASIRCLPRRFCAFINYTRREAAEAAFVALQNIEVEGNKIVLQLKHPVHATPPPIKTPGSIRQPPKA